MFVHLFAFLSFAAPLLVHAAEFRGQVVDPENRPVAGASIQCGRRSAVLSAWTGEFVINAAEPCSAEIRATGFKLAVVELSASASVTVKLEIEVASASIVVSATRSPTALEETGQSGTVWTSESIIGRQNPIAAEILREAPGVHMARSGRWGAATQLFVRGTSRTGTAILLDGMPLNDPGGDYNAAHLLTGDLDRVEVIRGAGSALFGSEAAGAVVQLETQRGDPERLLPNATLQYERGNFATDRWLARLSGGSGERLDYSAGAEQFHSSGEFPNDFYRNTTGSLNAGYRLASQTTLRGILRVFDAAVGSPNRTGYGIYDFDANRSNRSSALSLRLDDIRGRLVQRARFGFHRLRDIFRDSIADGPFTVAGIVRDVPGRVNRVELVRLIDPRAPGDIPAGARLVNRTVRLFADPGDSTTERFLGDYQGNLIHLRGSLVFGYEAQRQQGVISLASVGRNNHALFLHEQWNAGDRLFVNAGLRWEYNSTFGAYLTPRVALSWRLLGGNTSLPRTHLRFSAGRGITSPSLLQNFAAAATFRGNPDLRLEKTATYEAGLVQEWLSRRLRTEVAVFENRFRDLIVFVSPPAPAPGTWANVDAARARGIEYSAQFRLSRLLSAQGQYTLLASKVTRSNTPNSLSTGLGQELLRRPRHSGSVQLTLAPRRWTFSAGALFIGERQDSDSTLGVNRAPRYETVFAGGSYRVTRNVTAMIQSENLLNRRYFEVLGYSSLSRVVRGGVRVNW